MTDVVAVSVACTVAYLLRFGFDGSEATVVGPAAAPSYLSLTMVIAVAWVVSLAAVRSRHRRIVGSGPQEYTRVFTASWRLFAVIAVLAYLAKADVGRAYLAIAFPLGVALLLASRFGWRQWLRRCRAAGRCESSMIVVGHRDTAAELIGELMARPDTGYRVVGVCLNDAATPRGAAVLGVPVLGGLDDVVTAASELAVDTVAVTGSDRLTASTVRRLGWDLEPTGADLVIATALTDVAGPRILMTPVNGLPLVHVDAPRFTGTKYVVKTVADWVGAAVLTVLLAPLLLVIAALVRLSTPGPALFRQERVGHNGAPFPMLKFRTMHADAEARLDDVLDGDVGMYYKHRDDPRVTRLGRVLRKYSLDELPQLLNVLRGEMSLVGPRPQIDREVALYDRAAQRRLLVKPGLTGLWQVSGRSELTAEEAIRMDVFYVENWTLFGDLIILARTAKVMLSGDGAY